ncbi:MAG TPA: 3-oxoacyl-[acyl-carrier-protein] synthase III C-terminal domain-containing protein [Myxococcota bacterium]|nr:3-oxoacyl-[acyl-carrier-protein] synthase III C-terminal domain-containing protein [Myxococcota bacterium]HRY93079.1 3-oxoacyl-[acyl-carrier-protein] synthase III C-terminal domain-containing protein [Myxococcota bacterium]HSA20084.1 3-oxoacyl-[acyl-carrier-protein] synthase III C-terminal domain-containing protein [Myxococcota bacterium]
MSESNPRKVQVGIAGVGSFLPAKVVDAWEAVAPSGITRERFERIGAKRIHVCAPHERPSDMAIEASRRALADAQVEAKDLDLIIYSGSHKDHARWMASAKVQAELKSDRSFAFDLYQGCNGENMSLRIAWGLMQDDPAIRHVLLCAAERWDTTLEHPVMGSSFIFGDGASAAVLKRDHPTFRLLSTACRTWGEHHDSYCCPELGAANKLTPEVLARKGHLFQLVVEHQGSREAVLAFSKRINDTAREMIEEGARKAGVKAEDATFVLLINSSARHLQLFLEAVGLQGRRNTARYIEDVGHLGTGDVFYNLERARNEGLVKKGDLIVCYTGGGGYSFAVTWMRA